MVCFCFDGSARSVRILGASVNETRRVNDCAWILVPVQVQCYVC